MVHSRLSSSVILFSFVLSSGSISRLTYSKLGRIKKRESICAGDFRATLCGAFALAQLGNQLQGIFKRTFTSTTPSELYH